MEKHNEIQYVNSVIKVDTVLFFDMDGTLVDTNLANFLSYKKAIQSIIKSEGNLTYNSDIRFNRHELKNAFPKLSENEYQRIIKEKEEYYKDFLHETKINKPMVEVLLKYSKTNKIILVTNCRQDRATETLDYHGLTKIFNNIFYRQINSGGDTINKFQNAITELGVSPDLVVAFENEEIEIADAKKVGIQIINPVIVST